MALIHDDAEQELDSPRGIVGVTRGGSGSNLSVTGPGIVAQVSVGSALSVTGNVNINNVINVAAAPYNGVGDGVTIANTAIRAAIVAARAAGKRVYIPAGTWMINESGADGSGLIFPLGDDVTVEGAGRELTILRYTGTVSAIRHFFGVAAGHSATIERLKLVGIASPAFSVLGCSHLGTSGNLSVRRVHFDTMQVGIKNNGSTGRFEVLHSKFATINDNGILNSDYQVESSWLIDGNDFVDVTADDGPTAGAVLYLVGPFKSCIISNNRFKNCISQAVQIVSNATVATITRATIIGNTMVDCGVGGAIAGNSAIDIGNGSTDTFEVTVAGNTVLGASQAIAVWKGRATVTGNTLEGSTYVIHGAGASATKTVVTGNLIRSTGASTTGVFLNSASGWLISSNDFTRAVASAAGFDVLVSGASATKNSVFGNDFECNGEVGIWIQSSASGLKIVGNEFTGTPSAAGGCITVHSGAANPANVYIADNTTPSGQRAWSIQQAGVTVADNDIPSSYTESITVAPNYGNIRGASRSAFVLHITNDAGTIKHKIIADLQNGIASLPSTAGKITGASATANATPTVDAVTPFVTGVGLEGTYLHFDTAAQANANHLQPIAVLESNTTPTAYRIQAAFRTLNVNGTSRARLSLRLVSNVSEAGVTWSVALGTPGYTLAIRINGDLL